MSLSPRIPAPKWVLQWDEKKGLNDTKVFDGWERNAPIMPWRKPAGRLPQLRNREEAKSKGSILSTRPAENFYSLLENCWDERRITRSLEVYFSFPPLARVCCYTQLSERNKINPKKSVGEKSNYEACSLLLSFLSLLLSKQEEGVLENRGPGCVEGQGRGKERLNRTKEEGSWQGEFGSHIFSDL